MLKPPILLSTYDKSIGSLAVQVLFFDECESIFESRDKSNQRDVNMLLTEIERHDGAGPLPLPRGGCCIKRGQGG